jgi:hypothetical protein
MKTLSLEPLAERSIELQSCDPVLFSLFVQFHFSMLTVLNITLA